MRSLSSNRLAVGFALSVVVATAAVAAPPAAALTETQRLIRLRYLIKDHLVSPPPYLYHWAGNKRAGFLLRTRTLTEKNYPNLKGPEGQANGPGFYTSADPTVWSFLGTSPTVVAVEVAPGTHLLSESPPVSNDLRELYGTSDPFGDPLLSHDMAALGIVGIAPGERTFVFKGPSPQLHFVSLAELLEKYRGMPKTGPQPAPGDVKAWIAAARRSGQNAVARGLIAEAVSRGVPYTPPPSLRSALQQNGKGPDSPDPAGQLSALALRLFSRAEWGRSPSYDGHGEGVMDAWVRGVAQAEDQSRTRLPTVDDLFKLHEIAYGFPDREFNAFYRNRIARSPAGVQPAARKLLEKKDYKRLRALLKIQEPFHQFRDGTIGFSHPGLTGDDGFTNDEIDRLDGNPYLSQTGKKVKENGLWRANYQYSPPKDVERLTRETFSWLKDSLSHITSPPDSYEFEVEVIDTAAEFYRRLISIHPLWDGNGRTARLLRDWVLMHYGIPPPATTPENDLEYTSEGLGAKLYQDIQEAVENGKPVRTGITEKDLERDRKEQQRYASGPSRGVLGYCVGLFGWVGRLLK